MPYETDSGHVRQQVGDVVARGPRPRRSEVTEAVADSPPTDAAAVAEYREAVLAAAQVEGDQVAKPDREILAAAGRFTRDWRDDLARLRKRFAQITRMQKADEMEAEGHRLIEQPPPPGPTVQAGMPIGHLVELIDAHRLAVRQAPTTPADRGRAMVDRAAHERVLARQVLVQTGNADTKMEIEVLRGDKGQLVRQLHRLRSWASIIDQIKTLTANVERWGNGDLKSGDRIGKLQVPAILPNPSEQQGESLRKAGLLPQRAETPRKNLAKKFFEQGKAKLAKLRSREPQAREALAEIPGIEHEIRQLEGRIGELQETLCDPLNTAWNA